MFLNLLLNNPAVAAVWVAVILLSLTVHEFSHALIGHAKGDKTAELAGRLTLNPLSHIDPFGFILLLIMGFGWAKPVPYNPYNLKQPVRDAVHIAIAGPISNFLVASLAGLTLRALLAGGVIAPTNLLAIFLVLLVIINLFLMIFNLIPIHPLDGSKITDAVLVKPHQQKMRQMIEYYGPRVLFFLVILSLFTSLNIFFFVSAPAFAICDALLGQSCSILLGTVL